MGIRTAADDQLALVRLAEIGVDRVGESDAVHDGFQGFRHERLQGHSLQGHAFDRQAKSRTLRQDPAVPGDDDPHGLGLDPALRGLDALDRAALDPKARDLAVLDDVYPAGIGRAREPPGHGIVPSRPAAALKQGPQHGKPAVQIDEGHPLPDLGRRQELRIDAVHADRVNASPHLLQIMLAVREVQQPPLGEHDVVIEFRGQAFPESDCVVVEGRGLGQEIVRAHHRGVPTGVAAAEPALLQHCDVANTVLPGQVVRGRQPVPATADDHHRVRRLWVGTAPDCLPVLVVRERVPRQCEDRIPLHRRLPVGARRGTLAAGRPPPRAGLVISG